MGMYSAFTYTYESDKAAFSSSDCSVSAAVCGYLYDRERDFIPYEQRGTKQGHRNESVTTSFNCRANSSLPGASLGITVNWSVNNVGYFDSSGSFYCCLLLYNKDSS